MDWKELGFYPTYIGDNCQAYMKEYGDTYILITDESGGDIPRDLSRPARIGEYDDDGNKIWHATFDSASELLDFLNTGIIALIETEGEGW